jgi:hypothetical protein
MEKVWRKVEGLLAKKLEARLNFGASLMRRPDVALTTQNLLQTVWNLLFNRP